MAARLILGVLCALVCAAPASGHLRAEGSRFVDGDGREVILRGGALIKKFGDGLPVMTESDWANIRALGWNSIRLGTAWEFIEPRDGDFDEVYLDRLAALAREATARGIYVVVDLHQDVWGRPAGNGAPTWTTYPECAGTHVDLASIAGTFAANYFSPFTVCQFTRFWADPAMQDRYAAAAAEVARRIGDDPLVAGYDLMNEPYQGANAPADFEARSLFPFYARVTAALRDVDPGALSFLEPANAKNVHLPTASAVGALPSGSAYAPHVYGLWDANDAFTERAPLIEANMAYSRTEAELMGVPLWYGEFGMRRSAPGAEATLTQIYELADAQLAGASVWEYARNDYGVLRADGSLDPARAATVARPYPSAVAGRLVSFGFTNGVFEMEWDSAGVGETVVALPPVAFPAGFEVSLSDGAAVATQSPGAVSITAPPGRHTLTATRR